MDQLHQDTIARAIDCLRQGGVVAFPTDTLYALGADVFSARAIQRVLDIKQRDTRMALPVLLADITRLPLVATSVLPLAHQLAQRFWPGPLTLVVPKADTVPDLLTGGRDTVAVRVPNHPLALELLRNFGGPLTGTSANLSGGPDAATAYEVRQALGNRCDLVIEGGPQPCGTASTIVDLSGPTPALLRAGAIPWELLEPLGVASQV